MREAICYKKKEEKQLEELRDKFEDEQHQVNKISNVFFFIYKIYS